MANKIIPGRVMALTAAPMSVVLSEVDDAGDDEDVGVGGAKGGGGGGAKGGGDGGAKGGGGGGAYKTTVVGTTTPSAVTSDRPTL